MINYRIEPLTPTKQFIRIFTTIPHIQASEIIIQLPAWRPGRYEMGNFGKNIRAFKVTDASGHPLATEKIAKERWRVQTEGVETLHIEYDYYAAVLNAGSTYVDSLQLYINPVNCLCYVTGREHEPCSISLSIKNTFRIASGLPVSPDNRTTLFARNFDQLADCPIIASDSLQHQNWHIAGINVHLWFQGPSKPDWPRLQSDFTRFIEAQVAAYGAFPEKDYHFLFQITHNKSHHGVEHENSTVCMMGPAYALMKESYDEFLGLCSHEFYHAWNIKKIRPSEMYPYDLTRENFSRLGYVAEGVTTYYGDLMLYRSGVWHKPAYFETIEELLTKHFHSFGRLHMPVSEASYDTWIDGYEQGIPHRKTNIYTEGALLTFLLDVHILQKSQLKYSFDDVMKALYEHHALQNKGYIREDVEYWIEQYCGHSVKSFFDTYIYGTGNLEPLLQNAFTALGLEWHRIPSANVLERNLGMKISEDNSKVTHTAPQSPAERAGIVPGDIIVAINGFQVSGNLRQWVDFFWDEPLHFEIRNGERLRPTDLNPEENNYFPTFKIKVMSEPTAQQQALFKRWSHRSLIEK